MTNKFRVGDEVEVITNKGGNFITKGSRGKITEINNDRTPNDRDGCCYNIRIDFNYVPNKIITPEGKARDTYNGCYWVIEKRLKNLIMNWEDII